MNTPNSRRNLDAAILRAFGTEREALHARNLMANAIVGQMLPSGVDARAVDTPDAGEALCQRISDHRASIEKAGNLEVADFQVRMITCSFMWVPMAETALIAKYTPVWNSLLDGFGNHDPGGARTGGVMSKWDTLHPGREWVAARKLVAALTPDELSLAVESELARTRRRYFG